MKGSKLVCLFELIKTILSKKEKLIIVVEWLDLLKIVQDKCNELVVPHFIIEGKTKSPERKSIEWLLNEPENETMVLITTRKCLFYGTLFGVNNIIYLNPTENLESERNFIKSISCHLQKKACSIFYLICKNTVDSIKYDQIVGKKNNSNNFNF